MNLYLTSLPKIYVKDGKVTDVWPTKEGQPVLVSSTDSLHRKRVLFLSIEGPHRAQT